MSTVPDKVLSWLYSVLTNEYRDLNRTYADVAEALSSYPSLSPRTEVFTFENGASALLLLLNGTIPVQFRGNTYRFPIALWVPHTYPREPPIVYVTPSQGMLIRPGQHVSGDGRIYHPYLANFGRYWDKSSISDFLQLLRGVFAKEPPLISQQQTPDQNKARVETPPPPLPPPPEAWRRPQHAANPIGSPRLASSPPPIPPKPGEEPRHPSDSVNGGLRTYRDGPPPPPLPPTEAGNPVYRRENQYQLAGVPPPPPPHPQHVSRRQSSLGNSPLPYPPQQVLPPQPFQQSHHALESPVSPIAPAVHFPSRPLSMQFQRPPASQPLARPQEPDSATYETQQTPSFQQPPPQSYPYPIQAPLATVTPKQKAPAIDLLTSPLDVTLPSQTATQTPLPVPPVPPNPEKDALLSAISTALTTQTRSLVSSNMAALAPLTAQQTALRAAHATLTAELAALRDLDAALASNERTLRDTTARASAVMRDAANQPRPDIDALLVCPTVVGSQLYELAAEQHACSAARLALGRALDRGRVPVDVFVRANRQIAREEFLGKVLAGKAARGMGLEVRDGGAGVGNGGWNPEGIYR